jgi:diguanylate cyclase (GGDEF)-like protein/PAS domain S-box-containing protein
MTRRMRWWNSVAAQVWGMVLTCVLVVAALILVNTRAEMAHERSRVSADLSSVGATMAKDLASSLSTEGSDGETLSSIASQPAVVAGGTRCQQALGAIQNAVTTGYIITVDAEGTVLCSAAPTRARVGEQLFAAVPELLRSIAARRSGSGGPFLDPHTGALSMYTQVPMPRTRPGALVFVGTSQQILSPLDSSTRYTSLVVDTRTGTVLMHWPSVARAVGQRVSGTSFAPALASTHEVRTATGPDGVRRLYRAVPVSGTPYVLLVGLSEHGALAAVRASLQRNLLIGAGLVVVVALMGLFLQRRVARPARKLRRAIASLATDPAAPPAPTGGPIELASVAAAFNATTEARRRADGLSRAILQHTSDVVLVLDAAGSLAFVGPRAQRKLGLEVGTGAEGLLQVVDPDDRERVRACVVEWLALGASDLQLELRVLDRRGRTRSLDVRAQDLRADPDVLGIVMTGRDITERRAFEDHLAHEAKHDPLTGLANRSAVLERLAEDLDSSQQRPVCVFFIDLDRFKLVNDSHGHGVGDRLLVALGRALRGLLRPEDLVGRFGGDEFVVVTNSVPTAAAAEGLATRIRKALEEPFLIGRRELFVSGSVGIAMAEPGDAPEVLLREADTAMYRAKERGRNCSALFDGAMRAEAQRLLRTESDLHRALERDQLVVHFQPVVDIGEGRVLGVEALVRWNHPNLGLVPPGDFVPVAEETGLIVPIGAWVLERSCAWAAETGRELGRDVRVSVNISPRQLSQPDVVQLVGQVLERTGLRPELLCLEVTESVLVQDADAATRTLTALHELGVRLSIDDFGTGWSSLTYLQRFPVDEIKLDRSYVSRVAEDNAAATIVGALVGMAHAMALSVTAEGVETEEQLRFLEAQRCDTAQGYLFARPLPAREVEELLRRPVTMPRPRSSRDQTQIA